MLLLTVAGISSTASAQTIAYDTALENGALPEHQPLSFAPWEVIDPWSANAMLFFLDVDLPGNAGFDLRIRRVYNSKDEAWVFDIGMPRMLFTPGAYPRVINGDGSVAWLVQTLGNADIYETTTFWRYTASTWALESPAGITYVFDASGNPLTATDAYGNQQIVTYTNGRIDHIVQTLGNGQSRQVDFGYDALGHVITLSCQGRTWHYAWPNGWLTEADSPSGLAWTYGYASALVGQEFETAITVTTPTGGWVRYVSRMHLTDPPSGNDSRWRSNTLRSREWGGTGVAAGGLQLSYPINGAPSTTIDGTNGTLYHAVYTFDNTGTYWTVPVTGVTVGSGAAQRQTSYTWQAGYPLGLPATDTFGLPLSPSAAPLLRSLVVTQDGRTYTRTFGYSESDPWANFGQPTSTIDSGDFGHSASVFYQVFVGGATYLGDKPRSTNVDGIEASVIYDPDTGFITSRSAGGVTTTRSPDEYGNLRETLVADTERTTYDYSWGAVSHVAAPNADVDLVINPDGSTKSATRAGQTTSYDYDAAGRVTAGHPPVGNPITISYASDGRSVTRSRAQAWTTTCLDGFGRTAFTFDSTGARTDVEYDALGRVIRRTLPYTTTPAPDSCESPAAEAAPSVRFEYDALGRVTKQTNPDGTYVTSAYDSTVEGLRTTITDELGHSTVQIRHASGAPSNARLHAVTNAVNETTTYGYDAAGNLTRVTAPNGLSKTWAYDPATNRLQSEAQPESGTVSYSYDLLGRPKTRTDALDQTITYDYDLGDRVIGVTTDPATPYAATIEYDAAGNRTLVSNGYVTTRFEYDGGNRLKKRTDTITDHQFVTTLDYDNNDNVTDLGYPSGNHVKYQYDGNNRLDRVYDDARGFEFAHDFSYRPSGATESYTSGNGIVNAVESDPNTERPTHLLSSGGVLDLQYGYDDAGNVTQIQDGRQGLSASYGYDAVNRLTTAAGPWGGLEYAYDSIGNRKTAKVTIAPDTTTTTTYAYDVATNWLTSSTGPQYEEFHHDVAGRLTQDGRVQIYAYTPANLLETATSFAGAITTYRYDADGQRVLTIAPGETSRTYVVNELSEFSTEGGPIRWTVDYVSAAGRLLAAVRPAAGTLDTLTVTPPDGGRVTATPAGLDCGPGGPDCSARYVDGTAVTLTAVPDSGSYFAGWGGDCVGAGDTLTITLDASKTCTASFDLNRLTVTLAGDGMGTVAAAGLSCDGSPCTGTYPLGTTVTLVATAGPGSSFSGWSGDSECSDGTPTMTMAHTCTATFTLLPSYLLTIQKTGSGSAGSTVTSTPSGVACGATCAASYTAGTSVQLTAVAASGFQFVAWQGTGCTTGTVTMTGAVTCTAVFQALPCDADGSLQRTCQTLGGTWNSATCSCSHINLDPLMLTLDGGPLALTDLAHGVRFDMEGTGS
ncbi:MAG: hypothetical protein M0Z51_13235, partial [Propionibacterium sp.]|nr:hypothetical protein [Propionibacterium sp.]